MRKEFVLPGGDKMWLEAITGEVISERAWTETQVSSRAAVGYATSSGAVIGGGQKVTSTTIDKKQIWVRGGAGDKCFDFKNIDLNVLPGHKITVIDGGGVSNDKAVHFYIDLPTTGSYFDLFNKKTATGYLVDVGVISLPMFFLRIGAAFMFMLVLMSSMLLGWIGLIGLAVNEFYFLPKQRKPVIAAINAAIESMMKELEAVPA